MSCGFWYEHSLAGCSDRFGLDIRNKSITFLDGGNIKVKSSTWVQCGRGLAAFLSFKRLSDDEKDAPFAVQSYSNDVFYISSFLISRHEMFESIKRVTGMVDFDWDVK
ncbi:uncharacterized protein LY79DRAFT_666797 [Colletotrichum navitas]|uniref:Uncharacterized protein n=1 Tax=Colletotrichum navitas TaxID=681940 RepID=A0AAD8Q7C7_9PEZI|nr:uncharacterized protein LY79DRAFT_666797 [Colletotrichum navitas]KAK1597024.1 hypothetical protein LY79DRAFT_666797 [Colletotrichum navitas]